MHKTMPKAQDVIRTISGRPGAINPCRVIRRFIYGCMTGLHGDGNVPDMLVEHVKGVIS